MSNKQGLHPAVMQYAKHMQLKLDANKYKDGKHWKRNPDGSRDGWHGCTRNFLEAKLKEEVDELLEALQAGDKDEIRLEAADVGNIAMMLACNFGGLSPDQGEPETYSKWQCQNCENERENPDNPGNVCDECKSAPYEQTWHDYQGGFCVHCGKQEKLICQGLKCAAINGVGHSAECEAEHSATVCQLTNQEARNAGGENIPVDPPYPTKVLLPAQRAGWVYLAGPMSGIAHFNYPAFHRAAAYLRSQGHKVVNPAEHGLVKDAEWHDYIRADIGALAMCEKIALMPGYEQSKGAMLEKYLATTLWMDIIFLDRKHYDPTY